MSITKQEVVDLIKDLLLHEYMQRDIYETYSYYLFGFESPAIQQHLKEHMTQEQLHIEILQRYLMGYGAPPVLERLSIPKVDLTLKAILDLNYQEESNTVKAYAKAITVLENEEEYTSLRMELEDIIKQEQEHAHDLVQWLGLYEA